MTDPEIEGGIPTGSVSGPPPPVSNDVVAKAQDAAKQDAMGQNVPGQDKQGNNIGQTVIGEAGKEKTAKESTYACPPLRRTSGIQLTCRS